MSIVQNLEEIKKQRTLADRISMIEKMFDKLDINDISIRDSLFSRENNKNFEEKRKLINYAKFIGYDEKKIEMIFNTLSADEKKIVIMREKLNGLPDEEIKKLTLSDKKKILDDADPKKYDKVYDTLLTSREQNAIKESERLKSQPQETKAEWKERLKQEEKEVSLLLNYHDETDVEYAKAYDEYKERESNKEVTESEKNTKLREIKNSTDNFMIECWNKITKLDFVFIGKTYKKLEPTFDNYIFFATIIWPQTDPRNDNADNTCKTYDFVPKPPIIDWVNEKDRLENYAQQIGNYNLASEEIFLENFIENCMDDLDLNVSFERYKEQFILDVITNTEYELKLPIAYSKINNTKNESLLEACVQYNKNEGKGSDNFIILVDFQNFFKSHLSTFLAHLKLFDAKILKEKNIPEPDLFNDALRAARTNNLFVDEFFQQNYVDKYILLLNKDYEENKEKYPPIETSKFPNESELDGMSGGGSKEDCEKQEAAMGEVISEMEEIKINDVSSDKINYLYGKLNAISYNIFDDKMDSLKAILKPRIDSTETIPETQEGKEFKSSPEGEEFNSFYNSNAAEINYFYKTKSYDKKESSKNFRVLRQNLIKSIVKKGRDMNAMFYLLKLLLIFIKHATPDICKDEVADNEAQKKFDKKQLDFDKRENTLMNFNVKANDVLRDDNGNAIGNAGYIRENIGYIKDVKMRLELLFNGFRKTTVSPKIDELIVQGDSIIQTALTQASEQARSAAEASMVVKKAEVDAKNAEITRKNEEIKAKKIQYDEKTRQRNEALKALTDIFKNMETTVENDIGGIKEYFDKIYDFCLKNPQIFPSIGGFKLFGLIDNHPNTIEQINELSKKNANVTETNSQRDAMKNISKHENDINTKKIKITELETQKVTLDRLQTKMNEANATFSATPEYLKLINDRDLLESRRYNIVDKEISGTPNTSSEVTDLKIKGTLGTEQKKVDGEIKEINKQLASMNTEYNASLVEFNNIRKLIKKEKENNLGINNNDARKNAEDIYNEKVQNDITRLKNEIAVLEEKNREERVIYETAGREALTKATKKTQNDIATYKIIILNAIKEDRSNFDNLLDIKYPPPENDEDEIALIPQPKEDEIPKFNATDILQLPEITNTIKENPLIKKYTLPDDTLPEGTLPAGWTEHLDAGSGVNFYHNASTSVTQWEKPKVSPIDIDKLITAMIDKDRTKLFVILFEFYLKRDKNVIRKYNEATALFKKTGTDIKNTRYDKFVKLSEDMKEAKQALTRTIQEEELYKTTLAQGEQNKLKTKRLEELQRVEASEIAKAKATAAKEKAAADRQAANDEAAAKKQAANDEAADKKTTAQRKVNLAKLGLVDQTVTTQISAASGASTSTPTPTASTQTQAERIAALRAKKDSTSTQTPAASGASTSTPTPTASTQTQAERIAAIRERRAAQPGGNRKTRRSFRHSIKNNQKSRLHTSIKRSNLFKKNKNTKRNYIKYNPMANPIGGKKTTRLSRMNSNKKINRRTRRFK
jgi:hypothetical protein